MKERNPLEKGSTTSDVHCSGFVALRYDAIYWEEFGWLIVECSD